MKKLSWFKKILLVCCGVFLLGMLIPYNFHNPVEGATKSDYNPHSFWAFPWGSSVTHKGVDIFKRRGTPVHAASGCEFVLFAGRVGPKGGNAVLTLAPKWRLHYYAHLDEVNTHAMALVGHGSQIGTVGNSGNAASTPAHLHFSIGSMLLQPWRIDRTPHGQYKAFYLDPTTYLDEYHSGE